MDKEYVVTEVYLKKLPHIYDGAFSQKQSAAKICYFCKKAPLYID